MDLTLTTKNANKEDAYLQASYAKGNQSYVRSRSQITAPRIRAVEYENKEGECGSNQGRGRQNGRRARQKLAVRAV